jgi:CO/xanthine dehydrogenase FAD-binding subunit
MTTGTPTADGSPTLAGSSAAADLAPISQAAGYLAARSVEEAVAAMAAGARPVAGGTDLVVGSRQGKTPLPAALVGIHRIPGLATIEPLDGGALRIGALVTHAALLEHADIRERWTGLADAAAIVGSHATRANGTLGGNVMNASPAMDTGAPLLCHGAVAVLVGPGGTRRLHLDHLWTGPGQVAAGPDELLVGIDLPGPTDSPAARSGSGYVRLQYRRQMEIAIVGAAAVVELTGDTVSAARIAITALAPTIQRVPDAEAALVGTDGGDLAARAAADLAAAATRPISDVRGSAAYRTAMAAVVARRAIAVAVLRAREGAAAVTVPASDSTFGS